MKLPRENEESLDAAHTENGDTRLANRLLEAILARGVSVGPAANASRTLKNDIRVDSRGHLLQQCDGRKEHMAPAKPRPPKASQPVRPSALRSPIQFCARPGAA